MPSEDRWKMIRRVHRRAIIGQAIAIVLLIGGIIVFPSVYYAYWMGLIAFVGFLFFKIALQPDLPCPRCSQPFFLWSAKNSKQSSELFNKRFFTHFDYISAMYFPYCPHCDLPYEAPLDADVES